MFEVITDYPVAADSEDYLHPYGAMRDVATGKQFIEGLGEDYSLLDLGCASGQLVADIVDSGRTAVGLEGSDWPLKHHENWKRLAGTNLFTCDISRFFDVKHFLDDKPWYEDEKQRMKFDYVTAWEVLEHIPEDRLSVLMSNILAHCKKSFIGTVACWPNEVDGHVYHQTVKPLEWWAEFLGTWFDDIQIVKLDESPTPRRILTNDLGTAPKHWIRENDRIYLRV